MKLVLTALLLLIAVTPASAQTITIARSGTQPPQQGPSANFTGSVRVDPLFHEVLDGKSTDWMEKVADAQYDLPLREQPAAAATEPTRAQQLMGDIAPALADLTDRVLFGEVWERPQLSPRDRSLVTVSALIAMNRPDQLRSHLTRARNNGLTKEEAIETITHLAFYSGWPSAVAAVEVAREVFANEQTPPR